MPDNNHVPGAAPVSMGTGSRTNAGVPLDAMSVSGPGKSPKPMVAIKQSTRLKPAANGMRMR